MATGGSIQNANLGGRSFTATADSEATVMLGGFSNEIQSNGDGTARTIKTAVPWKVTGLVLAIDWSAGDMEFLQNLADGGEFAVSLRLADDTVLNGTGQIQGDLSGSTQASSATLELSGQGKLTQ